MIQKIGVVLWAATLFGGATAFMILAFLGMPMAAYTEPSQAEMVYELVTGIAIRGFLLIFFVTAVIGIPGLLLKEYLDEKDNLLD